MKAKPLKCSKLQVPDLKSTVLYWKSMLTPDFKVEFTSLDEENVFQSKIIIEEKAWG